MSVKSRLSIVDETKHLLGSNSKVVMGLATSAAAERPFLNPSLTSVRRAAEARFMARKYCRRKTRCGGRSVAASSALTMLEIERAASSYQALLPRTLSQLLHPMARPNESWIS